MCLGAANLRNYIYKKNGEQDQIYSQSIINSKSRMSTKYCIINEFHTSCSYVYKRSIEPNVVNSSSLGQKFEDSGRSTHFRRNYHYTQTTKHGEDIIERYWQLC